MIDWILLALACGNTVGKNHAKCPYCSRVRRLSIEPDCDCPEAIRMKVYYEELIKQMNPDVKLPQTESDFELLQGDVIEDKKNDVNTFIEMSSSYNKFNVKLIAASVSLIITSILVILFLIILL